MNPTPPEERLYDSTQGVIGVTDMHLVTNTQGWIVAGSRLYWTADQGCHWRDISPEATVYWRTDVAFFLDPRHGWVASPTAIYRTVDAAATWQTIGINYSADRVGLQFVDTNDGWLATTAFPRTEARPAGPVGDIFHTTDGGVHWTETGNNQINGGQILFITPSVGWALNYAATTLYRSGDGGNTWTPSNVPAPAGYDEVQLGLPSFATASVGVLPATLRHHLGALGSTYYTTSDGGQNWMPSRIFTAPPTPVPDVINGTTGIVAQSTQTTTETISVTSDGGQTWTEIKATGLPSIDKIDFVTPLVGWARPRALECVAISGRCSYSEDMLLTIDGGKHWRTIDLKAGGL